MKVPKTLVTGPEVYRICKDNGMDTHDLQMIEFDELAMSRVQTDFAERVRGYENTGRPRSAVFADAMLAEHEYRERERVVIIVVTWAKIHELFQFQPLTDLFPLEELKIGALSRETVNYVYHLDIIDAERMGDSEANLEYIPDAVFDLPNLKTLRLGLGGSEEDYYVKLKHIPFAIANAKKLESLHLQHCGLTELPGYIFTPSLRELKIGGNDIRIIPAAIGNAVNLEMLTAWSNNLEYISEEIGKLTKLKRLDLWGNDRVKLPNSIVNLGQMDYLNVGDIVYLSYPQSVWAKSNGLDVYSWEDDIP